MARKKNVEARVDKVEKRVDKVEIDVDEIKDELDIKPKSAKVRGDPVVELSN